MKRFSLLLLMALFVLPSAVVAAEPVKITSPMMIRTDLKAKVFKPVTAVMIKKPLKLNTTLRPLVPAKPVKPQGPDPKASVDLSDMLSDTDLLEDLSVVCGWDPHLIFQDKAAGNIFYYLPKAFLLVYDKNTGYGLDVQYNHLKEEGSSSVMVTGRLAAPHRKGDIQLLKAILKQAFELKASDKLTLKALSGIGATADLESISSGLSIAPEKVSLTMPSHLKQPFRLILSLDPDETEEILAQISREGLLGSLKIKVSDTLVPVPIHIQYHSFSGNRVEGFDQWIQKRPTGTLENISRFPLKIDTINGYKVTRGQLERISKKIKPVVIGPGKKKAFKLPAAKTLLGDGIILSWLGSSLETGCENCLKEIDRQVRKGVAAAASTHLKFEAIPSVFSDFDLYKIIVQVQSPYFNADPGKVAVREIELTEEDHIYQDLQIYPPQGKGPDPLLFKTRLVLVTADGQSVFSAEWKDSRTNSFFIGARQLEPVLEESGDDQ